MQSTTAKAIPSATSQVPVTPESVPNCTFWLDNEDFRVAFTVRAIVYGDNSDSQLTVVDIHGVVTNQGPPCAWRLQIDVPYDALDGGPGVRTSLRADDRLIVATRRTLLNPDDAMETSVVTREDGALLFASIVGARPPAYFDADLLPGLSLFVSDEIICQGGLARFAIRRGNDECWLDGGTQRCCRLGDADFEVQSQMASVTRNPAAGEFPSYVNLVMRAPGFLTIERK